MTARVPRGASFTVPFTCPCGQERAVFARGLNPQLPVSDRDRNAGPCSECGRTATWRIRTHADAYEVEVTHAS